MAYDVYRKAEPVTAGVINAKKGIMIVGTGAVKVKFYKTVDFNSGITIGAMGINSPADDETPLQANATSSPLIVPASVHTLVSVASGTTVYKLA